MIGPVLGHPYDKPNSQISSLGILCLAFTTFGPNQTIEHQKPTSTSPFFVFSLSFVFSLLFPRSNHQKLNHNRHFHHRPSSPSSSLLLVVSLSPLLSPVSVIIIVHHRQFHCRRSF
ncbi:hypothetical protein RND81_14G149900 [Saponaria officinalis]|uniref:Transmembrane protein n=1 Tax=Saponaria officinalis TaxID=3572 RepID=A0AAW1GPY5_SAPOF